MSNLKSLLWAALLASAAMLNGQDRAAWMQQAQWGVMNHYLADWQARVHGLTLSVEQWNTLVDGFDVETLARQLQSVGARYYQITIGQNSGYYLSPNATYDQIVGIQPSKCSRRDLVADLYEALSKRGIKLLVYLPSGAPGQDQVADAALEWRNGPYPNREFQGKWEQVIREWSVRWGKKVSGWWFDGCYFPNSMYRSPESPNFASFAAAARAGNPDAAIAFNPGVVYRMLSLTPDEDFTAGEIDQPELATIRRAADGRIDGTQIQMLSYLGQTWGMGTPRFSTEQVIGYTRKVREAGGAVTWDVPVELNGTISQPFLDQLSALGKAFAPREELPGKGLAQHPFLYCGEWQARGKSEQTMFILENGKVVWQYSIPSSEELGDCTRLSNGNILFSRRFGASEITPDKKIVWNYEAPPKTEIHTTYPMGMDRVLIMQNGNPAKLLVIVKKTGAIEKEMVLQTRVPDGIHGQFRHVRPTGTGTFLVPHMDLGKVVEYDGAGKPVWSVDAPSAWAAVRLKNGNTLISGNQHGYVREVNPKGLTVWEINKDDLPGIPLLTVQEVSRLANGNTLINNWAGSLPLEEWPKVVQLIEVTPDKKVVWALRDWTTLGPASSTQLLDERGVPEKGELQR